MKIEQKIILSNIFHVGLIMLIGFFAFQNLNNVLTKLRFVEIADDLNASFLEMRLFEKNYFLYHDTSALADIQENVSKTSRSIESVRNDIIRAIGESDIRELENYLSRYAAIVENIQNEKSFSAEAAAELRSEGKKLKEFSESITQLERKRVNEIITASKRILIYSFWAILLLAVTVSHFISQKILRSLRKIENMAKSVSEGNFHTIEEDRSNDEFGALIHAVNTMSEELSHREDQLIQSKKLASLGILTAGVAHELTNPLNNISMIAQTYAELYDKLGRDQRIDFMNKVESETDRIKEIVKSLLDFSKPKEVVLIPGDVNHVVQNTLKLMKNTIDISNVELTVTLDKNLPLLPIDAHQMQQVLVNLVTNAVQAMPASGRLFIGTRHRDTGVVEITVKDTGKGIAPEYLSHIFDPFFSTKGEGGTGLGLSVSYGIIKNHKGDIRVESKVGVGTTFTVELPVMKGEEL
jgi:signal transduction histidine kinase